MIDSTVKGLLTELQCQTAFSKYHILLSKPIVQDSKYDFIADINHKLIKIQCKTASVGEFEDFISIDCYTTNIRNGMINYYSEEDVDYFYTYYNNISYLIPYNIGGQKTKTLRFKTNQKSPNPNIKWAKDYTLEAILIKDFNLELNVPQVTIKINNKNNYCVDCGTKISSQAVRCVKCSHILQFTTNKPEREELKNMIRNESFVSIGNKYKISDNAVRKWCKSYGLPYKKTDIKNYSDKEWNLI